MATLVPCLVRLRADFDRLFPGRDRRSDGWAGDPAHQARDSDHNPDSRGLVHALDVDAGLSSISDMQAFVDHLVDRHRTGADKRLTYIIFNRRIWSASRSWIGRAYTGSNPHTEHAHFSASYTPARERDVSNWRLEEVPVALTDADKKWLTGQIDARCDALETRLLKDMPAAVGALKVDVNPGGEPNMQPWSRVDAYGSPERHRIEAAVESLRAEIQGALTAGS